MGAGNSLHAPRAPPPAGRVRLILSSKNLTENTGLIHLAGTELAPFAQPDTMPKLLDALSLGNNFFFREWWLNKRQER